MLINIHRQMLIVFKTVQDHESHKKSKAPPPESLNWPISFLPYFARENFESKQTFSISRKLLENFSTIAGFNDKKEIFLDEQINSVSKDV